MLVFDLEVILILEDEVVDDQDAAAEVLDLPDLL